MIEHVDKTRCSLLCSTVTDDMEDDAIDDLLDSYDEYEVSNKFLHP